MKPESGNLERVEVVKLFAANWGLLDEPTQ
jgi:hypothetical protein